MQCNQYSHALSQVSSHIPEKARQVLRRKSRGFTTIELVVVIILLGILTATIAPKFNTAKGFEEYSYQNELVAVLRAIQLRAMQQTDGSGNHTVTVTSSRLGLQGGRGCGESEVTNVCLETRNTLKFDTNVSEFSFNALGVPEGDCRSGCEIRIIGSETTRVKIESQGYIHAL